VKKNIFAVCDLEPGYACSFTEYLSHRKNLPFEIHAFTSAESFLAFEKEHEVELLLISARALNSAVKERPIGKIVVLSEGNDCRQSAYSCVYKYQSSAQVLRETLTAYSDAARAPVIFPVMKKTTKIFGIYSPAGGSGKTSFSLAFAQELGRHMPVLYLNLEGCSGLEEILGNCSAHSLSDLLYYARQQDGRIIHRINSIVQSFGQMDYIPPVRLAEDIHQAKWEDLQFLIRQLITQSAYEALVLEPGHETEYLLPLLELCDCIYMPVRHDALSACKTGQFETMLRLTGSEKLAERIEKIHVPKIKEVLPADQYAAHLLWGEVGDLARKLLEDKNHD